MSNFSDLLCGKQLLIFDFDGTVADTTPLHAVAFEQVLAPLGIAVDYPSIAGLKTLDAMRQCLVASKRTLTDAEINSLVVAKQLRARQQIEAGLQPLPGMDEFLHWARPRFRLAMVTSGSRATVNLALRKLGYEDWFDPLLCADDVRKAKPDPEGFKSVLRIADISPEMALVFEDSFAGFEAAEAAGVECVDARQNLWSRLRGETV
jgi:HAD superfamily hydrolase (TIGR01509 family)